jgi:hypothetical protein
MYDTMVGRQLQPEIRRNIEEDKNDDNLTIVPT